MILVAGCAPIEAPAVCDAYLDCAAVVAPSELGSLQESYDEDGTCWQGDRDKAETCRTACEEGLADLSEAAPSERACDGEGDTGEADCSNPNEAPVAEAGDDRAGQVGVAVVLDGSESEDADGDALIWHWSLETIPTASAVDAGSISPNDSAEAVNATFTPDAAGSFVVSLVVEDCAGESRADYLVVEAKG